MSNHAELRLMSEFKRPLHLDKGSKEYKEGLNRIRQSISIDDMQPLGLMKAIEMLPFPSGGFDLKYGSFDDGADIRMVGGQLLRTPSAVRTELVRPLMHSNEVKNRSMRCTPPSAAIIPNFHIPMRSYEVKNRTSTDIKSLRSIILQIEDGADGVIVGGSTGEGQLTSWDEQIVFFGGTTDVGQLTSTPSAVKSATVLPLMHSIKNRRARSAAIISNICQPMRSFEVKIRTSTDDVKSQRLMKAIKAPYLPDGRFDLEAYASLVNIEDGADGVIVGGTTGEGQLMGWDEYSMLIGHTINCFGTSIKVIENTGSNSTREAAHANEQGFAVGTHAAVHNNPFNGKTPYLPDRRFGLESYASAYASLVNREDGADGVIVGETTGEGQLMSWDEHNMLIGHTINCFGTSRKVIGNSGSNSTREAVHATEQRFAVGMHAAVHINPFNGKTTYLPDWRFDLEAYASLVNIEDGADGVIVADSTNFAGVKECVGHDRVKESTKEGIIVWSGNDDECHVSRWDHDATGVISVASNLVPGLMHELLSKGKNPSLNEKLLPLISWLFVSQTQ